MHLSWEISGPSQTTATNGIEHSKHYTAGDPRTCARACRRDDSRRFAGDKATWRCCADSYDAHLVVVLMVPILRVRVTNRDVGQPLYLPASNPAWNDHSTREAVVGMQELPVLLVRDNHVHRGIHGMRNRNLSAVGVVRALGELTFRSCEVHKPAWNSR